MTALANNRWDEASYQRIAAASGEGSELSVTFENGDELRFDIGRLVALGGEAPDWAALRTEPFEVEFEFGGEDVILSWLSIRSLLDDELAAHLARSAESEAEQVGHRLRVLRERRGLSGRQLAERVGIAPQSLSRIERGRHDIVFSKVQQLLAAMSYNLSDLEAASAIEVAPSRIRKALAQAGLHARTIERVLFGAEGTAAMLRRVRDVFGWSATDLAGPGAPPALDTAALAGRFKELTRDRGPSRGPYVDYVFRIASIVATAAARPGYAGLPVEPTALAAAIRAERGELSFASLLAYLWDHGVAVLPLRDAGQFHGACWLIDAEPVIVLKQQLTSSSRWLFDLAHEIYHVLHHLSTEQRGIVEEEEIGSSHTEEEQAASEFAIEFLLGSNPHAIAEKAVALAHGRVEHLKGVLPDLAEAEGVDLGVLANYMARRLEDQGINFWGAATNLQLGGEDPHSLALSLLDERLSWELLEEDERLLLEGALNEEVSEVG
jgi:transcriptional regulator with XRE-family HTH domain/Zn-dependent peptidase ImmA (M78 family)